MPEAHEIQEPRVLDFDAAFLLEHSTSISLLSMAKPFSPFIPDTAEPLLINWHAAVIAALIVSHSIGTGSPLRKTWNVISALPSKSFGNLAPPVRCSVKTVAFSGEPAIFGSVARFYRPRAFVQSTLFCLMTGKNKGLPTLYYSHHDI
jgi:hypothetical protein